MQPLSRKSTVALSNKVKNQFQVRDQKHQKLSQALISQIRMINEFTESSRQDVTEQAQEHIGDNDLILTYNASGTLTSFFVEAAETTKFEVIVLESAPSFAGHETAKTLASNGITTSLVPDAAVFAVMSRVDKVIITAHGIMATGGIVATSGALMIAHAAKAHQVPVFVIGAVYKLTPLYPIDSLTYNEMLAPGLILHTDEQDNFENLDAILPGYDYVPPSLVDLILTNQEGYTPENIYRAFNELYGKQGTHEFPE